MEGRTLSLTHDDVCAECGRPQPVGTVAVWHRRAQSLVCINCDEIDEALSSEALLDSSLIPATRWATPEPSAGEQAVAAMLEQVAEDGPAVILHNRRMPGGYGDIDHIAVTPSGVFVIDAKAISGKVSVSAPLFGREKLLVNGRDRTKLIDGLDRQVRAVRAVLNASGVQGDVVGILCFTKAEFPLLSPRRMRDHLLLHRREVRKRVSQPGFAPAQQIELDAAALAAALPPA